MGKFGLQMLCRTEVGIEMGSNHISSYSNLPLPY